MHQLAIEWVGVENTSESIPPLVHEKPTFLRKPSQSRDSKTENTSNSFDKKTWTKLKNGLFGWRKSYKKKAVTNTKQKTQKFYYDRGSPLTLTATSNKRKYSTNGVGREQFRPGSKSKSLESETDLDFVVDYGQRETKKPKLMEHS